MADVKKKFENVYERMDVQIAKVDRKIDEVKYVEDVVKDCTKEVKAINKAVLSTRSDLTKRIEALTSIVTESKYNLKESEDRFLQQTKEFTFNMEQF